MDVLKQFTVIGNSATVSILDTTATVEEARKRHDLSPTATVALGKLLTICSFMTSKFKDKRAKMSIVLDGGGGLGKLSVAGVQGGKVRGYVENPHFELPRTDGIIREALAVGKEGTLTVTTDLVMKEPYSGTVALESGEICDEFAHYFTVSEQQPSAVSASVELSADGVVSAGGVFIQLLPNCEDAVVTVLEDIMTNFDNPAVMLRERGVDGIIDSLFSHIVSSEVTEQTPQFLCACSREKVDGVVRSLEKEERVDILREQGAISVHCHFCNTDYVYTAEDVDSLLSGKKD